MSSVRGKKTVVCGKCHFGEVQLIQCSFAPDDLYCTAAFIVPQCHTTQPVTAVVMFSSLIPPLTTVPVALRPKKGLYVLPTPLTPLLSIDLITVTLDHPDKHSSNPAFSPHLTSLETRTVDQILRRRPVRHIYATWSMLISPNPA